MTTKPYNLRRRAIRGDERLSTDANDGDPKAREYSQSPNRREIQDGLKLLSKDENDFKNSDKPRRSNEPEISEDEDEIDVEESPSEDNHRKKQQQTVSDTPTPKNRPQYGPHNDANKWYPCAALGFLALIACGGVCGYVMLNANDTIDIKKEIGEISRKFAHSRIDDDVWDHFVAGLERMADPTNRVRGEPAVFFLVQGSDSSRESALGLSERVGRAAARYVARSKSVSAPPTVLRPSDLNSLERGALLDAYRARLQRSHALVVAEIEKVSPAIVQDFRYLCDEENPAVPNVAVFLIMTGSECERANDSNASKKERIESIERCLTAKWGGSGGLESYILKPLLARILSVVLFV